MVSRCPSPPSSPHSIRLPLASAKFNVAQWVLLPPEAPLEDPPREQWEELQTTDFHVWQELLHPPLGILISSFLTRSPLYRFLGRDILGIVDKLRSIFWALPLLKQQRVSDVFKETLVIALLGEVNISEVKRVVLSQALATLGLKCMSETSTEACGNVLSRPTGKNCILGSPTPEPAAIRGDLQSTWIPLSYLCFCSQTLHPSHWALLSPHANLISTPLPMPFPPPRCHHHLHHHPGPATCKLFPAPAEASFLQRASSERTRGRKTQPAPQLQASRLPVGEGSRIVGTWGPTWPTVTLACCSPQAIEGSRLGLPEDMMHTQ
ncbi:hypothetical protein TREES_T100010429 [Tupaia chinensis]|uniref:Uncharacterized protein n=1 Tax=Tupaia chinensis TaxID=246437 RepID=L9LAX9_TUPCH|nr:hypothetical protein TREES_T100010429 [Tupaia chinensis]